MLKLLWDALDQLFEVESEPGAADTRDPANAAMGDALGEQTVDFGLFFGGNAPG